MVEKVVSGDEILERRLRVASCACSAVRMKMSVARVSAKEREPAGISRCDCAFEAGSEGSVDGDDGDKGALCKLDELCLGDQIGRDIVAPPRARRMVQELARRGVRACGSEVRRLR